MKNLISIRTLTRLFLLIFILFIGVETQAQKEKLALELRHVNKDKVKYLYKNKKIKFWYQGNKFSGNIDSIGVSSFFVNETEYKVSEIQKIKIKFRATQITGGILGGIGLIIDGLGINIILSADEAGCVAPLVVLVGIVVTAIGGVGTVAGATVFFIGKKYDLQKKWKLNIAQINY